MIFHNFRILILLIVRVADNEICAETAQNPQNYLLPHPEDCTKFYSCQKLGHGRGWVAHLMSCPHDTGFDLELRICNFLRALPRCKKTEYRLYRAYQDINGISARLARSASLDIGEPQEVTYAFLKGATQGDDAATAGAEKLGTISTTVLIVATTIVKLL